MLVAVFITMVIFQGLGVIATMSQVGKPREPLTPGVAIGTLFITLIYVSGLVYLYHM